MNIKDPYNLCVTDHAITRYRERANYKGTDMDAANLIRQAVSKAREWRLKEEFRVKQLLTHDCQPAQYFKRKNLMYIVAGGDIITVHDGAADRWEPVV